MDRAKSRGFVALIFLLSRDSFDGNTAIFLVSEGPRDYPRSVIRSLPSVSGRPGDLPMPSINLKGHNHGFKYPVCSVTKLVAKAQA